MDRYRFALCIRVGSVVVLLATVPMTSVASAARQFGAIRDATRRAAEEAKKAEEARRNAEEAKKAAEAAAKPASDQPPPAAGGSDAPASPGASPAPAVAGAPAPEAAGAPPQPSFEAFSKFDFVPGERIVAFEDFSQDAIGDFPAKWNTNASGEVVTIAGQAGRWLKLTRAGVFTPEFVTDVPDNATVEFDLFVPPGFNVGFPLEFALAQRVPGRNIDEWESGPNRVTVTAFPGSGGPNQGMSSFTSRLDGTSGSANTAKTSRLAPDGRSTHIAMWRQRQRVRVYMDDEKVWDLPRALSTDAKLDSLIFFVRGGCGNCEYYLGNVRVATGAPDTRNKLITEGKWITHGILFDSGSDRVKGESYGALKEIAGVLTESAELKVQIVGHTDADGDEVANLDLSRRRAAAVKSVLVSEFKIDAARLDTDGKGEGQPIDKNDTPAGKANNRRVEFVRR